MIKLLSTVFFSFISIWGISQCQDELIHNNSANSIWMSCNRSTNPLTELGQTHWILYEFEEAKSIESLRIWNINNQKNLDNGAKRMRVDISNDGASWQNMGVLLIDKADASRTYTGQDFTDLGVFEAQYVLFTIIENHGGGCSGLAEVQFKLGEATTPTEEEILAARVIVSPNPASDFINVDLNDIVTTQYSYQVVDMTGGVLIRKNDQRHLPGTDIIIDGVQLEDGQYALQIVTDEGAISKKLIIINPK